MLLCSPIVLYDYPQIAPESATDFYDATEMDEMLTLRVMTLTERRKTRCASPTTTSATFWSAPKKARASN